MKGLRCVVPTYPTPTAFYEVSVRRLTTFPEPSSPRLVALPQLASGSSFHLSDVHSINRGLNPFWVSPMLGVHIQVVPTCAPVSSNSISGSLNPTPFRV